VWFMPCPSYPPWHHHSNRIWRRVQVIKLFIMQYSSVSHYFIPFRSKYSPQQPIQKNPSLCSSLKKTLWFSIDIHQITLLEKYDIVTCSRSATNNFGFWITYIGLLGNL
jgi:hypothetical protein